MEKTQLEGETSSKKELGIGKKNPLPKENTIKKKKKKLENTVSLKTAIVMAVFFVISCYVGMAFAYYIVLSIEDYFPFANQFPCPTNANCSQFSITCEEGYTLHHRWMCVKDTNDYREAYKISLKIKKLLDDLSFSKYCLGDVDAHERKDFIQEKEVKRMFTPREENYNEKKYKLRFTLAKGMIILNDRYEILYENGVFFSKKFGEGFFQSTRCFKGNFYKAFLGIFKKLSRTIF